MNSIAPELIEQFLVAKSILERVRTQMPSAPDRYTVAMGVLLAYDVAKLALAAIANHLGARPPDKNKAFLMNYFDPIQKKRHPKTEVAGKGFFSQLNDARNGFKHNGNFPDTAQFARVGDLTYEYVSKWCKKYVSVAFDDLDYSVLLHDNEVKRAYEEAKTLFTRKRYKELLELLALALDEFVRRHRGLPAISIGRASAPNAIKLAAFGVHANDFLTLQQFLPRVEHSNEEAKVRWDQSTYGHPANWDAMTTQFCLNTFLDIVIKLQTAPWTPSPMDFSIIYEHKIEAVEDDVPVWNVAASQPSGFPLLGKVDRKVIMTLAKGETLLGTVRLEKNSQGLVALLQGEKQSKEQAEELFIMTRSLPEIFGYVAKAHVKVTCVPRENDFVKENFPNLPEIPWQES